MKRYNYLGKEIKCWNCGSTENVNRYRVELGRGISLIIRCDKCAKLWKKYNNNIHPI